MYDDGIHNEHEHAHQTGLTRGFDLGWSYKGRFDRHIIQDKIDKIKAELEKISDKTKTIKYRELQIKYQLLNELMNDLKKHPNNRENITFNSF